MLIVVKIQSSKEDRRDKHTRFLAEGLSCHFVVEEQNLQSFFIVCSAPRNKNGLLQEWA